MEGGMSNTPDEIVINSIIEKVKAQKLIREKDIESLSKKLTGGIISEEDWRVLAEGKHIEEVTKNEPKNR
jgi:hypothetical protein